jgi:hypothetical protein
MIFQNFFRVRVATTPEVISRGGGKTDPTPTSRTWGLSLATDQGQRLPGSIEICWQMHYSATNFALGKTKLPCEHIDLWSKFILFVSYRVRKSKWHNFKFFGFCLLLFFG